MFLKYSFFWKSTVTVNLKKLSSKTICYIILVEDLINWKRRFEMFLIDHCAGDIGNKKITGKY